MGAFTDQIRAFNRKAENRADGALKAVALEALRGVLKRSPVDTGAFRGNWKVGVNQVEGGFNREDRFEGGFGAEPGFDELGKLLAQKVEFGDTVHITNDAPYGRFLERRRSTRMAPNGIVGVTEAALKAEADQIISASASNLRRIL